MGETDGEWRGVPLPEEGSDTVIVLRFDSHLSGKAQLRGPPKQHRCCRIVGRCYMQSQRRGASDSSDDQDLEAEAVPQLERGCDWCRLVPELGPGADAEPWLDVSLARGFSQYGETLVGDAVSCRTYN